MGPCLEQVFPLGGVSQVGAVSHSGGGCDRMPLLLGQSPPALPGAPGRDLPLPSHSFLVLPCSAPPEELPGSPLAAEGGCESPWSRSGSFQVAAAVGWLQAAQGSAGGALGLLCAAPVLQPGCAQCLKRSLCSAGTTSVEISQLPSSFL